jgi:hypothetical protein
MRLTSILPTVVLVVGSCVSSIHAASVDVRLCPVTTLTAADSAATLPTAAASVSLNSPFFLEMWTIDRGTPAQGVSAGYLNIGYTTNTVDATALSHGGLYTDFTFGTINDAAGLIDDFGGNAALGIGTPGKTEWARLGWIAYTATAIGNATFTPQEDPNDGFARFSAGGVDWSSVNAPSVTVNVVPEPSALLLSAVAVCGLTAIGLRRRFVALQ